MVQTSTTRADSFIQDNLDEDGHSRPNSDLRSIEVNILLEGSIRIIDIQNGRRVTDWYITPEIAQAVMDWDKRFFTFTYPNSGGQILRYSSKRCKVHGYIENDAKMCEVCKHEPVVASATLVNNAPAIVTYLCSCDNDGHCWTVTAYDAVANFTDDKGHYPDNVALRNK